MAERTRQMIHAPGHADGQLIFYNVDERLLLSGDQVLTKITPNIGLWPTTEAEPVGRYLRSLTNLAQLEVRLALPGHGRLIEERQARLLELQRRYATRLTKMLDAVGDGALAIAQRIFDFGNFSDHEVRFAVAETLEYLILQGDLQWRTEIGVRIYHR
jgi:glyoxylase-like metal-dependent hydrolase (beta-lactamase superfamily II)